jgi:predicted  nucleic acid-binding Zn ribbon protein
MERPPIKDKAVLAYVQSLEKKLEAYEKSPYVSTYIAIKGQIDDWNNQLTIGVETEIVVNEGLDDECVRTFVPGKIDLFAPALHKEFERAFKYFSESPVLIKSLKELRDMMTPEEKEDVAKKLTANLGAAEKLALDHKNGKS